MIILKREKKYNKFFQFIQSSQFSKFSLFSRYSWYTHPPGHPSTHMFWAVGLLVKKDTPGWLGGPKEKLFADFVFFNWIEINWIKVSIILFWGQEWGALDIPDMQEMKDDFSFVNLWIKHYIVRVATEFYWLRVTKECPKVGVWLLFIVNIGNILESHF